MEKHQDPHKEDPTALPITPGSLHFLLNQNFPLLNITVSTLHCIWPV